jgi:serine/threonine protein kinase/predicted secreted protein
MFLLGQNSPEEFAALDAHLESCEHCLTSISTLDAEDSLVVAMQRRHAAGEQTAQEGDVFLADWLKKLRPGVEASEHPASGISPDGAATVDEAPAHAGSGDTTVVYKFLTPSQNPQELGSLGRYQIRKVLGSGGMGVVFQAFDPDLQRLVALKTTLPALAENPSAKERFKREAKAAAAIKHDHIVTIYHVSEDHGIAYLAMEFLEGESLDQKLRREGRLPWREALRITRESAQGLAAAHQHGLIHRDIKPGNIWLETRGEAREAREEIKATGNSSLAPRPSSLAPRVKILDFGLALPTADNANLTQSGAVVGTPAFMAPEQCRGQTVDSRSDLFSLGCVLYRMATGAAPFRGNHAISTLIAIATTNPQPPQELVPELPPVVCDLIMRLLAKDPADRPSSAVAVIEAIEAIEQDRAQPITPVRRSRRPLVWALGGMVLACMLALVGYRDWLVPQPDVPVRTGQPPGADDPSLKAVSGAGKGPRQFFADPAHALDQVLDHREIVGADADAFRKWHASLEPDFRLAWLNTRQGTGPIRYNAGAVREKTPRLVRFRPELTDAARKSVWESFEQDGFRPLAFTEQPAADDKDRLTQSLLWIKDDVITQWGVRPGPLTEIVDVLKGGRGAGYRPYQFDALMHKDAVTFVITTAIITDRLWEAVHSLSVDELLAAVKSYKARGWRPDILTPYYEDGLLRFLLVGVGNEDGPADWRFRMEMTPDQYKQESVQQRERGLFPLTITSYGNDDEVRYAAIWVRCREPGTNAPESAAPDGKALAERAAKTVSWASAEPTEMYVDGAHALGEIVDFRELVGGTSEELRAWHEKLDPKFRVSNVTSRNGTGPTLYNAVAVQEKEPHPGRVHIEMTAEMADQAWNQNREDGYRQIVGCGTLSAGQMQPWKATQLWVKDGIDWRAWHGWFDAPINGNKEGKKGGFRPTYMGSTMVHDDKGPAGLSGNTIVAAAQGRAWEVFYTLSTEELLTTIEFYQRKGWRPDVIVPYLDGDQLKSMLVVVDNSDKVDWRFRMDMNRIEYRQESAKQSRLGLFPLALSSYGHEADVRYAAIWVRFRAPRVEKAEPPPDPKTLADRAVMAVTWTAPERKGIYADKARAMKDVLDFREFTGGTPKELRDWHEKLDPKFRVIHITSRKGTGPTLFNAVAVLEKKPLASHVEFELTQEVTDQKYKQIDADGFRPVVICATLSTEQKLPYRNTLVWVNDGDRRYWNWYGSLQSIIDSNANKKLEGYRSIYLGGTMFPGEPRYNTVLNLDYGRAWEVSYSFTPDELFSKIESYKRKGWRPDVLAPHWVGDMRHMLVGVDNSDQVDWRFRMDMSLADYQNESEEQKRRGLFPLSLVSYGNDADIRYAAIFVRYRSPAKE